MPDEADVASAIESVDQPNTPETDAPAATNDGQGAPDLSSVFSDENFDPNSLPAELQPAYKQMQAGLTRKFQEVSQSRQEIEAQQEQAQQLESLAKAAFLEGDEDAAAEFLEAIGYGSQDGEYDEYGASDNPEVAALKKELAEVKDFIGQQKQEAEQRQQAAHIDSEFYRLTGEGWDRDNADHEAILAHAAFLSPEGGQIDVEAGYKAYSALRDRIIEDYRTGKTTAAQPHNLTGTPASAALPENASPEERAAAILESHGF